MHPPFIISRVVSWSGQWGGSYLPVVLFHCKISLLPAPRSKSYNEKKWQPKVDG